MTTTDLVLDLSSRSKRHHPAVDGVRGVDAVDAGWVQRAAVGDRVGLVVGERSVGKQLQACLVERQAQRRLFGQLIE